MRALSIVWGPRLAGIAWLALSPAAVPADLQMERQNGRRCVADRAPLHQAMACVDTYNRASQAYALHQQALAPAHPAQEIRLLVTDSIPCPVP